MKLYYNDNLEKSLLWAYIIDWAITNNITLSHFYSEDNKIIYKALTELYKEFNKIDLVLLKNKLQEHKQLKKIWWLTSLIELTETTISSNIVAYEKELIELYNKRELQRILDEINNKIDKEDINIVLWELNNAINNIDITEEEKKLEDFLVDTLDYIEQIKNKDLIWYSFWKWFTNLDKLTWWLQKGKIYRIAWPSNVGKSWLLYNFLINLLDNTDKISFFTLENDIKDILKNFFWILKEVNTLPSFIKKNNYDFEVEADYLYWKKNLHISKERNIDKMFRIAVKNKSDFIFIDYLQLIDINGNYKWIEKDTAIATTIQKYASKYNIGVIDLSQVSNSTKREWANWIWSDEMKGGATYKETADFVLHIFPDIDAESAKQIDINNWIKDKFFITYNKIKVTKNRLWPWVWTIFDYELDFNKWWKYLNFTL